MRQTISSAAVIGILTVLAACGSEADPAATAPTPSPTPLTRAAWVQQANAACRANNQRLASLPEPKTAAAFPKALRTLISSIRTVQRELRALQPPAADKAKIALWLEGNDQQIAALNRGLAAVDKAAKTGDFKKTEAAFSPAIGAYAGISVTQEKFAKAYGLTDC